MRDHSSRTAALDPLSEMLRGLHLEGVEYARYAMASPWGLLFPIQAAARFHFVAERGCWLRAPCGDWVRLEHGDAVLLPRGAEHVLADTPGACTSQMGRCEFRTVCGEIVEAKGGGEGEATVFFSASMTFNVDAGHPLLRLMPDVMWVHELARQEPGIPPLIATMSREMTLDRVGAGGILTRLADVVAAALIRSWVESGCGNATGWIAAARDPDIGRVLAAIHLNTAEDWTVGSLARIMGASRSAFAERFAAVVGETPARYVAQVRMHQARQWLGDERAKIAVVARRLGYESEASFSRAFKRVIGASPSRFRPKAADPTGQPTTSAPLRFTGS